MAERPISLGGVDGVSSGTPGANAEGGDAVGEAVGTNGARPRRGALPCEAREAAQRTGQNYCFFSCATGRPYMNGSGR